MTCTRISTVIRGRRGHSKESGFLYIRTTKASSNTLGTINFQSVLCHLQVPKLELSFVPVFMIALLTAFD